MRIESLGLPGSGKSTLVTACRDRLAQSGQRDLDAARLDKIDQKKSPQMPVLWPQERVRQAFSIAQFALQWPGAVAFFQRIYGDNARNLTIVHALGGDHIKFERAGRELPFWVDEGFFHFGVHAIMTQPPGEDVPLTAELVAAVPQPDALIVTDADPAQALQGIRQRAGLSADDPAKDKRFRDRFGTPQDFQRRADIIASIKTQLQDRGTQVVSLPAHGPIDQMVDQCLAALGLTPDAAG